MSSMTIPDCGEASFAVALVSTVAGGLPGGRDGLVARLGDVERLIGWVHAQRLLVVRELAAVSPVAEADVAAVCRVTVGAADRMMQRSRQITGVAGVVDALAHGVITGAHGDVLAESLRAQDPAVSKAMRAQADVLLVAARTKTVEHFRRHLAAISRDIRTALGISRSGRQRHDTRCRTWFDKETGMWHLSGVFDPITKQDHLRALAMFALVTGKLPNGEQLTLRGGGVDISVVVDVTNDTVEVDWGNGLEVPVEFLIELLSRPRAKIHGIAVRDGVVVYAPGRLDCGRDTRLANRAQRRALRAMYKTCAIHGCEVEFGRCDAHHILPWEAGGLTDLANLSPKCRRHHDKVHTHGWHVSMDNDRTLHVTVADGTELPRAGPNRHWG